MSSMTSRSSRFLFFLLIAFSAPAFPAEPLEGNLQNVLEEFHAANPIAPGIVVHVGSASRDLKWTAAVGTVQHESTAPLTADHTFRTASNTKTYVAAAVLRLVEESRLSLDDPLGQHLSPEIFTLLEGDGYDLGAMTVGQVLTHTSGLFEHPADPRYEEAILADPHHHWTRIEQITRCVEWGDPVGAAGEKFSYSDTGYIILGSIIEEKTGRNLGIAVRNLLEFDKLGLDKTWWEVLENKTQVAGPRAHQYYGDLDTHDWDPSLDLYGGGGLVCDVEDLACFTQMLLQGRVLEQDATLATMIGRGTSEYRMGLACTELGNFLGWGHTGFWNTFVYYVPALDVTVSGCILNHHADKGRELAKRLVKTVAADGS